MYESLHLHQDNLWENDRHASRQPVDEELRNKRLQQLLHWIDEDPHPDLLNALRYWQDDVSKRLPKHRPIVVKLPECFVVKLKLESHWVCLTLNDGVYLVAGRNHSRRTGRKLVPPQEPLLEDDPLIVLGNHSE